MSTDTKPTVFRQMLALGLGLTIFSLWLTSDHGFSWTWMGRLGWWSLPLGGIIATLLFVIVVWGLSHRWLRLPAFYFVLQQLHRLVVTLTWPQIVLISALAGLSEELLFRGALQSWLEGLTGVYSAIFLSSLVFAALHAMTLYYFVTAFLLSVFFGYLFHLTHSMLLLVTVHAIYDVIAIGVIAKKPHWLGLNKTYEHSLTP